MLPVASGRAARRMQRRARALVLCYHAITDSWRHQLAVPPAVFEQQLRNLLRLGFRPAAIDAAARGHGKLLHVTFDDALASVLRALPALERLRVPATVFVCSGYAEDGRALELVELGEEAKAYSSELTTLNWDEVGSLAARGVEIGSHTVSHAHLTLLSDAELEQELVGSRERLEDMLGQRCRFLAYPYAEHDERVRAAARRAGYVGAFVLDRRPATDRYALPRLAMLAKDRTIRLALKASPLGTSIGAVRSRLRTRSSSRALRR